MVSDSVLDYAMEGTDPLEVQNRLLSGIRKKTVQNADGVFRSSMGRDCGF